MHRLEMNAQLHLPDTTVMIFNKFQNEQFPWTYWNIRLKDIINYF